MSRIRVRVKGKDIQQLWSDAVETAAMEDAHQSILDQIDRWHKDSFRRKGIIVLEEED